jgi:dihydroorotase
MPVISRRSFLATTGACALVGTTGKPVRGAMGPDDKFDLVIKGGDVLDPSQALRGKRELAFALG